VLPQNLAAEIDLTRLVIPPVFKWLAAVGNIEEMEMLRTFNCGVGMVVVVAPDVVEAVTRILSGAGEHVFPLGRLSPREADSTTPQVIYQGKADLR